MPARSASQYRFMQLMANNPKKKRDSGIGPSPEVARKFINETPPKKRKQWAGKPKSSK